MRYVSRRPPQAPFARFRPTRRVLVGAVATVSLAALAVSCSEKQHAATAASRGRSGNAALRDEATMSAPAAVTNESMDARGSSGRFSAPSPPPAVSQKLAAEPTVAASSVLPGASPLPGNAQTTQLSAASSMIIRDGYAGIEVDSLDPAIARVRALAQRVGGYVANTSVQGGRDQLRSASLEVKVPAERFDEALSGLAPIGKVESVNVSAQDVGEEYVDINARVENAHRLEARLIALLANRTGRLQDVLSVERELARVREEIERYEGRLRFLRARVATSTLTVNVHERSPIITPVAGDGPIVVALREAWRNFVGFVAAVIASLGVVVPLGALVFVGWLGVRRWVPWRSRAATPPVAGSVSGD